MCDETRILFSFLVPCVVGATLVVAPGRHKACPYGDIKGEAPGENSD